MVAVAAAGVVVPGVLLPLLPELPHAASADGQDAATRGRSEGTGGDAHGDVLSTGPAAGRTLEVQRADRKPDSSYQELRTRHARSPPVTGGTSRRGSVANTNSFNSTSTTTRITPAPTYA